MHGSFEEARPEAPTDEKNVSKNKRHVAWEDSREHNSKAA